MCVVVSTIYEGSDESKSKTGSTDSQASSHRSSSTASSGHSATTQCTAASTHNWSAAVSGMMPPCHVSVTEDVASVVCASCMLKRVKSSQMTHRHGASVLCVVHVYSPAVTGTQCTLHTPKPG